MNRKEPGSVLREEEETKRGNVNDERGISNVETRTKVEFKLETYEGQEERCAVWFHGLERQMAKLKINKTDYMAYAINSTMGKEKTMITILDERHKRGYDEIKVKMTQIHVRPENNGGDPE